MSALVLIAMLANIAVFGSLWNYLFRDVTFPGWIRIVGFIGGIATVIVHGTVLMVIILRNTFADSHRYTVKPRYL